MASYVLEIDWDDDDDYGDTGEDVSEYCLSVSYRLGRSGPSPVRDRALGGTLTAKLRNPGGLFSPRNANGALYGSLAAGKKIRFRQTAPETSTRWTGFIKKIRPVAAGDPYVTIEAYTALARLERAPVYAPGHSSTARTDEVIDDILDAVGWPSGLRALETGNQTTRNWWAHGISAPAAMREIEDTEGGFLYDNHDGEIVFENRDFRKSLSSQDVWSDVVADGLPFYDIGIAEDDSEESVINHATGVVTTYLSGLSEVGALILLVAAGFRNWHAEVPFDLAPGQSKSFLMLPTHDFEMQLTAEGDADTRPYRFSHFTTWNVPTVDNGLTTGPRVNFSTSGGVTAADIDVAFSDEYAQSAVCTVTNNHATGACTITALDVFASGPIVKSEDGFTAENSPSKAAYGFAANPYPSKWLSSIVALRVQCNQLVTAWKDPQPFLKVPFIANTDFAALLARRISEKVTITATEHFTGFGIDADYFIEGIEESIVFSEGVHRITFLCSPAALAEYEREYFEYDNFLDFTEDDTWDVPAGVTEIAGECWGAGGGSGSADAAFASTDGSSGGGGGGGYSRDEAIAVTPAETLTMQVPTGGAGGSAAGQDGGSPGDCAILRSMTALVLAESGSGSAQVNNGGTSNGGAGGLAANGVGTTKFSGGNGANGSTTGAGNGGGGGGGAGDAGNGNNGSGTTGGTGGSTGGGTGGTGRSGTDGSGTAGTNFGAGGGGSYDDGIAGGSGPYAGAAGARGHIRIWWNNP